MPHIIVKYKDKRTLDALIDFSKYFDFSIEMPEKKEKEEKLGGVTIIPADDTIDTIELQDIFSIKPIDAKKLRKKAWQRRK